MKTEDRFSKKMTFEYEPKQQYLHFIEKQRNEKEQAKLDSRVQKLLDEQEDIREFKMRLIYDIKQKNQEKMENRLDFMTANDDLMATKLKKQEKNNNEKYMDRINYFPFNHGDAIEDQRR